MAWLLVYGTLLAFSGAGHERLLLVRVWGCKVQAGSTDPRGEGEGPRTGAKK